MDAETDGAEPTIVGVLLPRTTWMVILSLVVSDLCQDKRKLEDREDWEDGYLEREDLAEPAQKIVPVLLEAIGPGDDREDVPPPQEARRMAEDLWAALDVRPEQQHWAMAREITIPWPDNRYARMAEHFLKKAQREEWGEP